MNEIAAGRLRTMILQTRRDYDAQIEPHSSLRDPADRFVSGGASSEPKRSFAPPRPESSVEKEVRTRRVKEDLFSLACFTGFVGLAAHHSDFLQWLNSLPDGQLEGVLVGASYVGPLAYMLAVPLVGGVESESKSRRILARFGTAGLAAGAALGSFVGPMVAKILA